MRREAKDLVSFLVASPRARDHNQHDIYLDARPFLRSLYIEISKLSFSKLCLPPPPLPTTPNIAITRYDNVEENGERFTRTTSFIARILNNELLSLFSRSKARIEARRNSVVRARYSKLSLF
jgi:hypothetical protein